MYSIFQTPHHQKATNLTPYIYLQKCPSHDGKPAETKRLLIALKSLVCGHISNCILLKT